MIRADDLAAQFYPVDDLDQGLFRCGDELPWKTIYTYFLLDAGSGHCPFIVSKDRIDDAFARMALETCGNRSVSDLAKIELGDNYCGFTHLLCVPHGDHSELKGRSDADRERTTLCIPIFRSEYTGTEPAEAFVTLRREIVPTLRWIVKSRPGSYCASRTRKPEAGPATATSSRGSTWRCGKSITSPA